uniref:Uncharacterized protein n=1 Tax=Gossypium raimondii TaxID=29730 RepID=A0A0D2Q7Q8_GOSRA|nr:hypothetical protein B456_002G042400 [Gossypium raimondii]
MREMIFIMIYVSFDMILGAYLIGNMTALIVKGSKKEKFRDKMADVIKYMNRNKLERDHRNQIKGHLRLQYENFINQIVIRLHEEFFLSGEVIMEQGNVVDQLYFVCHVKQLESNISFHIGRQEAELALRVNGVAYNGDFYQLKILIRVGADPNKTDCDGKSPSHLTASKGYEDITSFLIRHSVDINLKDKFRNTPLLESIKNGHDNLAALRIKEGASLNIDDTDRWGNTPLDEAQMCGNKNLIKLLEDATWEPLSAIQSKFPHLHP